LFLDVGRRKKELPRNIRRMFPNRSESKGLAARTCPIIPPDHADGL
jgi:hypothetical protein